MSWFSKTSCQCWASWLCNNLPTSSTIIQILLRSICRVCVNQVLSKRKNYCILAISQVSKSIFVRLVYQRTKLSIWANWLSSLTSGGMTLINFMSSTLKTRLWDTSLRKLVRVIINRPQATIQTTTNEKVFRSRKKLSRVLRVYSHRRIKLGSRKRTNKNGGNYFRAKKRTCLNFVRY